MVERNSTQRIAGIDEAGRGPVIGPLVVAGVLIENDEKLKELKVRDSKKCTPKSREKLAAEIEKVAIKVEKLIISAEEIDLLREELTLNTLEAKLFATVIECLEPETVYIDSVGTDEVSFRHAVETELRHAGKLATLPRIISSHKADELYPVVSAASIVAKVTRDRLIEEIKNELGLDCGSGYPSDCTTIRFIENWLRTKGTLPPHIRRSWATVRRIKANRNGNIAEGSS